MNGFVKDTLRLALKRVHSAFLEAMRRNGIFDIGGAMQCKETTRLHNAEVSLRELLDNPKPGGVAYHVAVDIAIVGEVEFPTNTSLTAEAVAILKEEQMALDLREAALREAIEELRPKQRAIQEALTAFCEKAAAEGIKLS